MAGLQETVGTVIRRERRERGLTLRELAERAALSVVYLGEIERGKKCPAMPILESLAGALDLAVPDLLELVVGELREATQPVAVRAVGFRIPSAPAATPRIADEGALPLPVSPDVTAVDLRAFFASAAA